MSDYIVKDDYFAIEAMLVDLAAREMTLTAEENASADEWAEGVL